MDDRRRIIMERYKNYGGDSGVIAYEIGVDSITVQFNTGSLYKYDYQSAGRSNIEEMKKLALAGQGLNSFIMRIVKNSYSKKLS
jgi:hypothetical protein